MCENYKHYHLQFSFLWDRHHCYNFMPVLIGSATNLDIWKTGRWFTALRFEKDCFVALKFFLFKNVLVHEKSVLPRREQKRRKEYFGKKLTEKGIREIGQKILLPGLPGARRRVIVKGFLTKDFGHLMMIIGAKELKEKNLVFFFEKYIPEAEKGRSAYV